MKKWPGFSIIVFVTVYAFTSCTNPFGHHDHSGGIAYFKANRIPFPFVEDEVDSADVPFTVDGGVMGPKAVGTKIIVHIRANDSIDLLYLTGFTEHSYHQKLGERISNNLFSVILLPNSKTNSADNRSVYSFKFLNPNLPKHDGGVGYYSRIGVDKESLQDITESTPVKLTVIKKTDLITNVPFFFHLPGKKDTTLFSFEFYRGGKNYWHSGHLGDTLKDRYLTGIFQPTRPLTADDLKYTYLMVIER